MVAPATPEGVELEAVSVQRKDLPDDFPFYMLEKNFAVLKITIRNKSEENWSFEIEDTQAFNKKGKKIKILPLKKSKNILEISQKGEK